MSEKYYVPSLLLRATERFPVSEISRWYIGAIWGEGQFSSTAADWAKDQVHKSLYRYMKEQLEIAA